ncbi:flavodoxin family protein [Methanoculleus oceani]|uniref:Flavodoxin family protein n=1 Tax=Methanoculleus oceani TaxID=2184756 RepID=A0ABD4TGQ1_9EURY|nr:flavodoxin family protein [Methanoculleus sp. CWC-02]MCM2466562.1 flavodoxin family protein [Methanoculleus sp. CWC-02]
MKILVIMGSPRKGNTYRAAQRIEDVMRSLGDVEFEYLMLSGVKLEPCRGCHACFEWGEERCPVRDDAPAVEEKMHDADGVIFASPVYGLNVTGLMKTFIDRFSYIFHRPRFFDKKALLLTTAGAVGEKDVLDYLEDVAGIWGFDVASRAGIVTPPGTTPKKAQENDRKLETAAREFFRALAERKERRPGLRSVIIFHGQRATFDELGDAFPADHAYWKEQGWLDPGARYYTSVPVNPLYDAVGRIVEWVARRRIRRDLAAMR